MTVQREDTYTQFDNVVISDYITLANDEFRLSQTFIGGMDEDGNENLESSMGCVIELNEITARNRDIIPSLLAKLTDDGIDAEVSDVAILNTFPDVRQTLTIEDYSSYCDTQQIVTSILDMLKAYDKVA